MTLSPQFNPNLTALWLSLKRRALFSFLWSSVTPNLTLERISFGGGRSTAALCVVIMTSKRHIQPWLF